MGVLQLSLALFGIRDFLHVLLGVYYSAGILQQDTQLPHYIALLCARPHPSRYQDYKHSKCAYP